MQCSSICMRIFIVCLALIGYNCDNDWNATGPVRNRRIIYGSPLIDFRSFNVVGYFVHISLATSWSWLWAELKGPLASLDLIKNDPSPARTLCGGALLTPSIVQTACHCLTESWSRVPHWAPFYQFPILKNGWEHLLVLHHGYTMKSEMKDGVWSRKFIVHLECKTIYETGEITHDFGWILTRKLLPEVPWAKTNFAPILEENEIAVQYYETMKREAVCLHVGFGRYFFDSEGKYGPPSPLLMHGWRVNRNYWECYLFTQTVGDDYGEKFTHPGPTDYIKDCSWVCSTFFGKQRAVISPGDSGSPVTCSNQYFAVTSGIYGHLGTTTNNSWAIASALGYAMFENSANYRESMVTRMMDYAASGKDHPPEVRNRSTVDPFNPNAYYYIATTDKASDTKKSRGIEVFLAKSRGANLCRTIWSLSMSSILLLTHIIWNGLCRFCL